MKHVLGHGPNTIFANGVDQHSLAPVGPWTHISNADYLGETPAVFASAHPGQHLGTALLPLGADGSLGRDLFLRLLYGAQTSLEVAVLATLGSVALGVLMGLLAGYFRGWVDTVVSRLIEVVMVFPALLFIIAVRVVAGPQLNSITFGFLARGVFTLVLIFSVIGWFYPARIIRGVVFSLREKEFVEAARMTGASDFRIMRSHLLPHLVAPIVVYSTLIIAVEHPRRGRPLVPRPRHRAADRQLGKPARCSPRFLPHAAVADGLARPLDPPHDARVQPARRRPAGRVRPPRPHLADRQGGLHQVLTIPPRLRHRCAQWFLRNMRRRSSGASGSVRGRGRSHMRRKQVLSLFMLVLGVAMLVAAISVGAASSSTKKAGSAEANKGGTLKLNQAESDFDFVDPQLAYRTDDWSMIYTTSMPLVGFQEKAGAAGAQLVPVGATAFPTVSKDGKTYTFHIRPGLKFSDGSPVTAASYQRSWERILSPKMGSPLGVNLSLQDDIVGGKAFLDGKAAEDLGHLGQGPDPDVPPDLAERHVRVDPVDAVVHGRSSRTRRTRAPA